MSAELSMRRLEANKKNAARSTGPRTKAGKKRSRWNALKHGLTAKLTLVPGFEDPKEYRKLLKGFLRALKPRGAVEKCLVQELAACRLKVTRGFRAERNKLESAADNARASFIEIDEEAEDEEAEERGEEPKTVAEHAKAAQKREKAAQKREKAAQKLDFFQIDDSLEHLGRYQVAARRYFNAVLTTLRTMQRERKKTKRRAKEKREKK